MNFDHLAQRIDDEVIDRGSPEYVQLPKPNNARFDRVEPQAVVLCKTSYNVAEAIAFIRRPRARVGHAMRWSMLRRTLLNVGDPDRCLTDELGLSLEWRRERRGRSQTRPGL